MQAPKQRGTRGFKQENQMGKNKGKKKLIQIIFSGENVMGVMNLKFLLLTQSFLHLQSEK